MRKDIIKFGGKPITLRGREIKAGDIAQNFSAVNQDLSKFNFYNDTKGKIKVISVAPSIDTSVCSLQTTTFNQRASEFKDDVEIVTITVDLPFAQKRFCGAKGIENIQVVSDHKDLDFGEKYGFVIDEMRLLSRGIVVVDRDNTVKYVEYVEEVTNEPNYEKALEEVRKLI
ncbi:thiol peroxidase [Maledivibacter halophilus]|uniref:Thiol peroxidase (Atypical 2-Cys peroxiredoxin) n=1 Tax=Maledivibacter halophilus TaxID=36842 RepID=A0A1T5IVB8_9FIRM|nr:thiol peroxidase [Maledivibacter halophilus]SKC42873.1 thiol peroxidase (atypical 2-Cys peroxiredoxin) [Maledivibacter halophilus]